MLIPLIVLLVLSLIGVVKGAGYFLEAAEKIGRYFNLPAFVIGVVLVGFGTSLPELATSLSSIIGGHQNVTLPNIIGSNMANILLIVGISTLFLGSIIYKKKLIHLDLPYLLGVTFLFVILVVDGGLSWVDSAVLVICFLFYLFYTLVAQKVRPENENFLGVFKALFIRQSAEDKARQRRATGMKRGDLVYQLVVAVLSVALLGLASRLAVMSMLEIATIISIAVSVITFVTLALGTSLPELMVSFKVLKKGQGDLFLGNIIGSSIFNILLIGGIAGLIQTQVLDTGVLLWSLVGLVVTTCLMVVAGITQKIGIWQGGLFVILYIVLISKIIA